MVWPGCAVALSSSLAGSFFKRGYRVRGLLGMFRTPAKPGLLQPVEQIADAGNTAVFNPIVALNQTPITGFFGINDL
jgi:hypothetical protein